MTKKEALRRGRQYAALQGLGFTPAEAEALRRISLTLHRWHEHECNGAIQREGENGDGAPRAYSSVSGRPLGIVPDRERGALARLDKIVSHRNSRAEISRAEYGPNAEARYAEPLSYYLQTDPRGCALYILRPGDVPEGADVSAYYTRGIAVY